MSQDTPANQEKPFYFVASHKVLDRHTVNEVYVPKAIACLNKFDVEILAVDENTEIVEGQTGHDRLVILRFPNRDEALRWYHSAEYQSMIDLRLNSVEGTLVLAEGLSAQDLAAAGVAPRGAQTVSAPQAPRITQRPAAPDTTEHADSFRSGELTTSGFDGWSDEMTQEFQTNTYNGQIGTDLMFENDSVRVWHMTLKPGEKMPVHRHVLTYFWTAITPGRFLQRTYDGTTYESDFDAGLTHYYDVGRGEFALHNLENVGTTTMIFVAVELKKFSANVPLSLFNCQPRWRPQTYTPQASQSDSFRSGELTTSGFDAWPTDKIREFETNAFNGRIGTDLVFENPAVRVWLMTLRPGEAMPVHRHVLTYFWTAITPGRFLQRTYDGTTYASDVEAGLTHFYNVGAGEFALHNLENIGTGTMIFCAVELKTESANPPLPVS